jgi:ParB family chromosome partitioning protein
MARTAAPPRPAGTISLVPIAALELHPRNPRRDPGDVAELAASIREQGILEPLIVVTADRAAAGSDPQNARYLVVAGGRRLAAAKVAKLESVPVLVRDDLDESAAAAAALVENLQREDLDPIEQAEAYRSLLELTGWKQEQLAAKLGVDPTTVSHALRLLKAPALVQQAVREGRIGAEHARVTLQVPAELASALPLKKGIRVEQLRAAADYQVARQKIVEKIRAAQVEAIAEGERRELEVVWSGEVAVPGAPMYGDEDGLRLDPRVSLEKVLGDPGHRVLGVLEGGEQQYELTAPGATYSHHAYLKPSTKTHDELCKCRAIGIVPTERGYGASTDVKVVRVCISPAGFAAYVKALAKGQRTKRDGGAPTKADREKARAARARDALREVQHVLQGGRQMGGMAVLKKHGGATAVRKLTRGGVEGDGLRLVLYALTEDSVGYDAAGPLWDTIAKLPRRDVQRRVLELGAADALGGGGVNRSSVVDRILEHYGFELAAKGEKAAKGGRA